MQNKPELAAVAHFAPNGSVHFEFKKQIVSLQTLYCYTSPIDEPERAPDIEDLSCRMVSINLDEATNG